MERKKQNALKAVLTGNFVAINAYIKKEILFLINYLTFHFKTLEKKKKTKYKATTRKKIIKIRV